MHGHPSAPGAGPAIPAASSLLALSGTVLEGRYALGRVLGAGGMGAVYEATHLRLDRTVAIKVLRPVFVGHEAYIKRFLREAKVASRIRHRNVVEIHDYGEAEGGLVYSVMELLHGGDLDALLRAQPQQRLPWPQAQDLLQQLASGLRAAHVAGIIHRDIKPANCLLTTDEDGRLLVKLVDFGIAKVEGADHGAQLTATAEVLGTPSYMAPELVMTKSPASPRSDVYSLGVVAYRMLTGHVPFTGETSFQVLHRACFEPPRPLRELAPDVPPALDAFVQRMLAKAPDERPADMQAVRDGLRALGPDPTDSTGLLATRTLVLGPSDPSEMGDDPRAAHAATEILHPLHGHGVLPGPEPSPYPSPVGLGPAPPVVSLVQSSRVEPWPPPDDASPRVVRSGPWYGLWIGVGGVVIALGLVLGALAVRSESSSDELAGSPEVTLPSTAPPVDSAARVDAAVVEPPPPEPSPTVPAEQGTVEVPEPTAAPAEDATATRTTEPAPQVEPAPTPRVEPAPQPKSARARSQPKPAASGPPSDATMKARIIRSIRTKCADVLGGQPLRVSFIVLADGTPSGLNATPTGAAAKCAMARIKGQSFRKRNEPKAINLSVE